MSRLLKIRHIHRQPLAGSVFLRHQGAYPRPESQATHTTTRPPPPHRPATPHGRSPPPQGRAPGNPLSVRPLRPAKRSDDGTATRITVSQADVHTPKNGVNAENLAKLQRHRLHPPPAGLEYRSPFSRPSGNAHATLSSSGLGHRVFIPATRVRLPLGSPFFPRHHPLRSVADGSCPDRTLACAWADLQLRVRAHRWRVGGWGGGGG